MQKRGILVLAAGLILLMFFSACGKKPKNDDLDERIADWLLYNSTTDETANKKNNKLTTSDGAVETMDEQESEDLEDPDATPAPSYAENDWDAFAQTMYDYSFAGTKSAPSRVREEDRISVTEYGVLPDSGQDDSERIAQAIYDATAKGKYLYFPKGTYYVKNVKVFDTAHVRLCGDGEESILKTADDAVGEEKWDIALGLYRCDHCVVRNLTFDGNNEKVAGNLTVGVLQLRIEECENAIVVGCRFQNNNSGNINIVGHAEGLKVYYCDFLNSDCSVIVMPGYVTKGYICKNFIDGQDWVWSEPISLYNAPEDDKPNKNVIISGNDIRNHSQGAGGVFLTYPSTNIHVSCNYFYNCGAAIGCGSRMQNPDDARGPKGITCRENVIDSPTWHGFALLYADDWFIDDNEIRNLTDGFAIYLDQCTNCDISDNSIDGSEVFEVNCSGNMLFHNE